LNPNQIRGIHYESADILGIVDQIRDQDITLYASVPHYAGGYTKMFSGNNLAWNARTIPEFDPNDFPRLLSRLADTKVSAGIKDKRRHGRATHSLVLP